MVTEASWQQWKPTDFTPYLDRVFRDAFGAQRLLYGSDWPVCQVAATYSRQLALVESHLAAIPLPSNNSLWAAMHSDFITSDVTNYGTAIE